VAALMGGEAEMWPRLGLARQTAARIGRGGELAAPTNQQRQPPNRGGPSKITRPIGAADMTVANGCVFAIDRLTRPARSVARSAMNLCNPAQQTSATKPVGVRGSASRAFRLAARYNDRAALPPCRKLGTAFLHLVKRLPLGHEQAHTVGPGSDRPAILGVLDDESRCCCSLSHKTA
jgi:hypothetical protein